MTDIFQFPQGYLGLLGSKAGGQNPTQLGSLVNGVTEMTPFYLAGKALTTARVQVSPEVSAAGASIIATTVPPRKAWLPMFQNVTWESIGAGDTAQLMPILYAPDIGLVHSSRQANQLSSLTVSLSASIDWFRNPVLIPPGWSFGYFVITNTIAITGQTATHTVSYYELDI